VGVDWANRTPWYMIPLISIETTKDESDEPEPRPSPLELILILAPNMGDMLEWREIGVSASSRAILLDGGGPL